MIESKHKPETAHTPTPITASEAAEQMLRVFPPFFKQMMSQAREEMPDAFGDMGESQFRIIHMLKQREFTISEMADCMRVRTPTVSRMIDTLAERALVDRHPDATDRRKVWLQLTPVGRDLADVMETRFLSGVARFLQPLSAEELGTVASACVILGRLLPGQRGRDIKFSTAQEEPVNGK
jgi:DNA-binding MarR family transcriptional regulator